LGGVRFLLVAVGRPRNGALAQAIDDYERRAAHYWPLEVAEVREEPGREGPEVVRRREGERLLDRAGRSLVVAVEERGACMDSREFAAWLQELRERAGDVAFAIGGAHGLDERLFRDADRRLSLAPWTLPHELARLVLAEQLYRAGTIVRREPYHK
jgi:23S rRNA (pseudouridine1915-N3)-methyltransferase